MIYRNYSLLHYNHPKAVLLRICILAFLKNFMFLR